MRRIEAVNALSRAVGGAPLPLEELRARVKRSGPCGTICRGVSRWRIWLFPGSFAVFFGGSVRDGLAAMLCSMVLYAIGRMGARIALQPLVLTVLSAAAMCLAAVITVEAGLGQALDKIIIETLCC